MRFNPTWTLVCLSTLALSACGGATGVLPWPGDAGTSADDSARVGSSGNPTAIAEGGQEPLRLDPAAANASDGAAVPMAGDAGRLDRAVDRLPDATSPLDESDGPWSGDMRGEGATNDAWQPVDAALDLREMSDGPEDDGGCSAQYDQCGGAGWWGPTCCVASSCTVRNPYYSQCL